MSKHLKIVPMSLWGLAFKTAIPRQGQLSQQHSSCAASRALGWHTSLSCFSSGLTTTVMMKIPMIPHNLMHTVLHTPLMTSDNLWPHFSPQRSAQRWQGMLLSSLVLLRCGPARKQDRGNVSWQNLVWVTCTNSTGRTAKLVEYTMVQQEQHAVQ